MKKLFAVLVFLVVTSLACGTLATPAPLPTYTPYPTYTPVPMSTPVLTDTPAPTVTPIPDYQAMLSEMALSGGIPPQSDFSHPRKIDPPGLSLENDQNALGKIELEWYSTAGDFRGLSLSMLFKDNNDALAAWQEIRDLSYFDQGDITDERETEGWMQIGATLVDPSDPASKIQSQILVVHGQLVIWVVMSDDPEAKWINLYISGVYSYLRENHPEWLEN